MKEAYVGIITDALEKLDPYIDTDSRGRVLVILDEMCRKVERMQKGV